MKLEPGQVAVITGGGSGIGRALALACAARGMSVAIGDIDQAAAQDTVVKLKQRGAKAIAHRVDVTKSSAVLEFATRCFDDLGPCNLLCNNAGVLLLGALRQASAADWRWVMDVNLYGIVNGVQAFLPRMEAARHPGHILNTVSLRGIAAGPSCGVYAASKFAALGYSETLRMELADMGIGVTALCPWSVDTAILTSERNRPDGGRTIDRADIERLKNTAPAKSDMTIDADIVAQIALEAVEDNRFYAMTHPGARVMLEQRHTEMVRALDDLCRRHPELP